MPASSQTQTIGELVRDNPARARVFETLGIDYCCGGKVPLDSACREHNLDREQVQRQLDEIDAEVPAPAESYATMSLTDLADHVENRHHAYLREELPRIGYLAGRVANAHGERDPRLIRVRDVLASFGAEMLDHMAKEERLLFPSIRKLESEDSAPEFGFGSIANPIRQMEADHDNSGDALAQVRELTDGYASSSAACNTHLALLDALVTLERDTHEHVHKENNILFPGAIRLEESRAKPGGV